MALNPLDQINAGVILAIVFIFFMTYFLLRRILLDDLIDLMESREKKINEGFEKNEAAGQMLQEAEQEGAALVAEAEEKAFLIAENLKEELESLKREEIFKARAEAEKILTESYTELKTLKSEQNAKLKQELLTCSITAVEKITGKADENTLRFLTDRLMQSRNSGN